MVFDRNEYNKSKVTCSVCEKEYIKANMKHHYATKKHQTKFNEYKESLTDEEKQLLKTISEKFGIEDIKRLCN